MISPGSEAPPEAASRRLAKSVGPGVRRRPDHRAVHRRHAGQDRDPVAADEVDQAAGIEPGLQRDAGAGHQGAAEHDRLPEDVEERQRRAEAVLVAQLEHLAERLGAGAQVRPR